MDVCSFFVIFDVFFLIEVIFLVWFSHVSGSYMFVQQIAPILPCFNFSFLWCYLQWLGFF